MTIRLAPASFVGYRQKDWYTVDFETARPLFFEAVNGWAAIPGVRDFLAALQLHEQGKPSFVTVHRSHLPLLTTPEALALLTHVEPSDWDVRTRWAQERGFTPRVTQHQAIDFIAARRGTLLADEMRLGKTPTCVMSHDPDRGPLVVVAPLSTRAVWLAWMKRCFPELPIGVLTGTSKHKIEPERLRQPLVFCHYDIVKHWQSTMRIGTLVFDEAHQLCNPKSDRSKAAVLLASRAEKLIAATGTPVWSRPPNLWNLVGMLAPAAWGTYFDFGMRYGEPMHNGYGVEFVGATNTDELNARLAEVKIRRLWSETRDDLPPISRNVVVADINEATSRKLDILAAKLKKERSNAAANLALYRSQLWKIVMPTAVREAERALACGEPVVVWTWHKDFAIELGQALNAYVIHGDIPADERERRMDAWRAEPARALVATMAVAQVGIDLSHAHLAIFAELDWTPAVIAQTEMRTYDPSRAMNVTFIVANHIVHQRLVRTLVSKLDSQDPLGFGAAVDAIDALRDALEGPKDEGDLDRFLEDILSTEFEVA